MIVQFDLLTNLQKDRGSIQVESLPPLRLAPPAIYHEKVKKVNDFLARESSSSSPGRTEIPSGSNMQLKELRVKGSSIRFPLKSSIFGNFSTTLFPTFSSLSPSNMEDNAAGKERAGKQ